jgi:hypothetical protein
VAHEAVGVKPASLIPKEIPMIKKNPVLKVCSFLEIGCRNILALFLAINFLFPYNFADQYCSQSNPE